MADDRTIPHGEEPTKRFDGPSPDQPPGRLSYPGAVRLLRLLSETTAEGDPIDGESCREERSPTIPGYTLDRQLGAGGGGTVYHGFREGSDRPLAIKVLRARAGRDAADDTAARRAWRELDLTSQLRLPAVPRVIDYGVADAHLFVASEYIDGLPLDRYTEERGLARRERVELLARVAEAVHSVHEHGVIHRDLKPSNILIDSHGEPSIIDLGIAVLAEARPEATMTAEGAPLGTPAFMAPEQARGERSQVSTRTDVYGLGATALLVLTGHGPHELERLPPHVAVAKVAREPARDPRAIDPTLPRGLAAVLGTALDQDPARRYASAASFAADLRRWLRGEAVEATRPGAWVMSARWVGRHPVWATSSAWLALIAAGVGTLLVGVRLLRDRPDVLVVSSDRSRARLVSVTGETLATIGNGYESSVTYAGMVDDTTPRGTKRLAVFAANGPIESGGTNGQLWVTSINDLKTPIWRTSSGPPDLQHPPVSDDVRWIFEKRISEGGTRPFQGEVYHVNFVCLEDVFPEPPEVPRRKEIIVAFGNADSLWPTRIYDLDGNVLFEAWHWGPARTVCWFKPAGLLIYAGERHGGYWRDRGFPGVPDAKWPLVIFALKPKLGARIGWVSDPTDIATQPFVAWYRAVLPPSASTDLVAHVASADGTPYADKAVAIELQSIFPDDSKSGGVWFYLGPDGKPLEGVPPRPSDLFNRRYARPGSRPWGRDDAIHFGNLPPLVGYTGPAGDIPSQAR